MDAFHQVGQSDVNTFFHVLAIEADALGKLTTRLYQQQDTVEKACDVLVGHCRGRGNGSCVIVSGVGKAGHIAAKVASTLSSLGCAAVFINPVEALHGDLGFVRSDDCSLVFSYSGETIETVRFGRELKRFGCYVVAVTKSKSSTLGEIADIVLELGEIEEACHLKLAPTSSAAAMLAVGDALAVTVACRIGTTKQQFARNHPAGGLGLHFRPVSEYMRVGDKLVCVHGEDSVRQVIRRVSAARTAAAILVDNGQRLVGIFTDGDLRRSLLQGDGVLEQPVREYASIPCYSVCCTDSVASAIALFRKTFTEELPVVDSDQRVVGILCLKDIAVL